MGHETNRAVKISNLIKMAAPEQETGGNPGPGPPMGGCNGNSRLVLVLPTPMILAGYQGGT